MSTRISSVILILCFLLIGCKTDEPTIPPSSESPTNLISNGSFESNGLPTLDGWNLIWPPDTSQLHHLSFSHDTPPNGGTWSFEIDTLFNGNIQMATDVDLPKINHKYKLSFWAKTTVLFTEVILLVTGKGWHGGSGKSVSIRDSLWREYVITSDNMDSLYQKVPDSIRIFQVILSVDHYPFKPNKTNFDLIKLEQSD